MAGLDWLEPPTNRAEFDELDMRVQQHCEELYARLQYCAAVTNQRLRRPKSGTKMAEKLAWMRIDLKAYARATTKPMAQAGAAAIAMGKAFRLSHTRFSDINRSANRSNGSGSGFDFD